MKPLFFTIYGSMANQTRIRREGILATSQSNGRYGAFLTTDYYNNGYEAQQKLALPNPTPPDARYVLGLDQEFRNKLEGPLNVFPTVLPQRDGGGTEYISPITVPAKYILDVQSI